MAFPIDSITAFATKVQEFALNSGPLGIFTGMALESSIIPIPSEAILVTAGAIGFSPVEVAIWGGLGSTVGGIIGYGIGRLGGRPVLDRFGKYIFVTPKKLKALDGWFKRWGAYAVLIGRLIPFIPFKVFSIASGVGKMDLKKFTLFTLIGVIPRAFLLSYLGYKLLEIGNIYLTIAALLAMLAIPFAVDRYLKRKTKKKK